jgi:hypothetical protein
MIEREHGATLRFGCYQNDDLFGLSLEISDKSPKFRAGGGFDT